MSEKKKLFIIKIAGLLIKCAMAIMSVVEKEVVPDKAVLDVEVPANTTIK